MSNHVTRLIRQGQLVLGAAMAFGCSSGGDGGTDPGTIALSLSTPSASVEQGGSTAVTATLTRSGGFTGAVNLTVTGAPSGVTATVSNVSTSGSVTTATVTIQVGASTAAAVYPLVVRGTGSGVSEATANFSLTVTAAPAPAYTLTLSSATLSIVQGSSTPTTTVNLVRTNFTGSVTLSVDNLPTGVTAAFNPASPLSGNSSVLTLTVAGAATPGTFTNLLVRGAASGLVDRTAPLTLTITAAGSFTLAVAPAGGVSMVQGTVDNSKTINITRTNYTQPITFTAENLPTGLSASFASNPTATNSTALSLTATAGLAPNVYNITVRGTGPAALRLPGDLVAVEASVVIAVTVTATPAGGFTLTTTPSGSASITQGTSAQMTVNVVRTGGFAGGVTLTTTGLPAGLTFVYSPNPTTAASSTLQITATAGLAVGAYPVTIRGNATGQGEQTVNLTINVTAASGSGNVTVDFSGCAVADRPVWAAFLNGTSGSWVVLTAVNNVYSFTINAGKGGFTYVTTGVNTSQVIVQYYSQAEWTAGTINFCGTTTPSGRTLTGTVAGMASFDFGHVSFGGTQANALPPTGNFTMNDAGLGTRDLVIYTHPQAIVAASDRMLIDRDENPATSFGTRNMQTDPFAFLPLAGLVTISNPGAGETLTHGNTFFSRATCDLATLYFGMPVTGSQFNAYGAQNPLAGERHGLSIQGTTGFDQFRTVFEYFNAIGSRTVAMGPQVPVGTVTQLGTNYSILRNQYTAPSEFNTSFTWTYNQQSASKSATVVASFAYFGGTAIDLKIGEYTGLAGWLASWAPQLATAADTYSSASGSAGSGGICSGLTRFVTASRTSAGAN